MTSVTHVGGLERGGSGATSTLPCCGLELCRLRQAGVPNMRRRVSGKGHKVALTFTMSRLGYYLMHVVECDLHNALPTTPSQKLVQISSVESRPACLRL
jgi:hypothetical protein